MSEDYGNVKYMEADTEPELRDRKVWFGQYRGIRYEINSFTLGGRQCWTHYIILNLDEQLPEEHREKFWLKPEYRRFTPESREYLSYDYTHSIVGSIEFHGGCTFYKKESGHDDKVRVVKIGCDYQHYWDEGKEYGLKYVHNEVKASIDSLLELVGPVKVRSWGDGNYRLPEEFTK